MSPEPAGAADDPVVVIGMAVETPGGVDDADGYWSLLTEQREALGPFPTDRGWSLRQLFDGSRRDGFKPIHNLGGFLADAATFDPEFFGISPREAAAMDPQQRVALRIAWRACENSGINPDDLAGHDVGCYVGASALEYGPGLDRFTEYSGHLITGTSLGVISGRIAYQLDLAGPALTVDTSCSSALTAFHTAVTAVRAGDCDLALTGGVCVMGSPGYFVEFSKQHALSDDGHCRPYSAHASGTVWSEGAAMFLLQRRSRAVADGRQILAEVRASCVNQDGRSVGLTAPSGDAQTRLFARAITQAGVRPEDIGMVEGHGTGTPLGDRTELRSLAATYGATAPGRGALLGSVKSNVGHSQAAAGALGLAKVLIAAERATIPPTLHADEPSREMDWEGQGLRLATKLTPWPARDGYRVAAVSAFGMSGTNAHLVVAMPRKPPMQANSWPDGRVPVLLSAHAVELLSADADAIGRYLDNAAGVGEAEVAGQLARTRRVRRHRAVVRAGTRAELADGLRAVAAAEDHPLVARSTDNPRTRVAFVFPGQGSQWPGMGAQAYRQLPAYRCAADECGSAFLAAGLDSPLRHLIAEAPNGMTFTEAEVEGAQFIHHVALAAVWRSCGVVPDVTVGHSLGEVGAAYVAGAISLPGAVRVVGTRAGVVDRLPGRYAVAALGIGVSEAHQLIAATPGWLELAVVNAETSIAVSGDRDAVLAAVEIVRGRGQFGREITVNFPVHTSILEPLRNELQRHWPTGEFADTAVQFIGGATGAVVPAGTPFADYWYRNLRDMVRFDRAVEAAVRCGVGVFAEMSAHPSLLFSAAQVLGDRPAVLVGSGRRDEPLVDRLSANIAAVAVTDPEYRFSAVRAQSAAVLRGFPNAPMRATHLWAAVEPQTPTTDLTVTAEYWRPQPPAAGPQGCRRVAVLDLGSAAGMADAVHAALERATTATLTAPADADLLVVLAPTLDTADVEAAAGELADRVGAGLFDYVDAIGSCCRDVWLVTTGAEQVAADDAVAAPAQAALAAMHRSIGFEHPDHAFHHLDLARAAPADDPTADTLVRLLLTGGGELALRGAVALCRTLDDALPATPWSLDSGVLDNVVITGGSGAIGRCYAAYLAARGARNITLLSRRAVDAAELSELAGSHRAEIISVRCDITEVGAIDAAADAHGGDGASLLIHAAGTAEFATRDLLSPDAIAGTLGAKVVGLARLVRRWRLRPDARILLCSSVIGVWGGQGTAGYAAGNRMVDVMAAQLRAQGRSCTSMRWGLWQGDSAIVDGQETIRVERSGLRPMQPRLAIEASLRDHPVDPLVLSADPARLQMFFGSQSAVPGPMGVGVVVEAAADAGQAVRTQLAAVLDIADPDTLDLEASLFDLGVDSLLALDLRNRLRRALGRTVPLAKLLGGITGTDLITELTS